MQAEMPWFETAEDATTNAIQHSGKSFKGVAHALWPSLKMDTAYARLKGSLNSERPEKLTADEHIFIANFCGQFDFTRYVCAQTHHGEPEPVTPADEQAQLQQDYIQAVKQAGQIAKRLEQLQPRLRAAS